MTTLDDATIRRIVREEIAAITPPPRPLPVATFELLEGVRQSLREPADVLHDCVGHVPGLDGGVPRVVGTEGEGAA